MKNYIIRTLLSLCFFSVMVLSAQAQTKAPKVETIEFRVEGICGMCKDRIENAALIKGVKLAEWNQETHLLKVIFKPKKVSEAQIYQAVADAGHDNEKVKASDEAYGKLHHCCSYREMSDH